MIASIIVVFGLPITVGAFLPSNAYTIGYDMDPEPVDSVYCAKRLVEKQLTWPGCAARWEDFVLIGEEEMTVRVVS